MRRTGRRAKSRKAKPKTKPKRLTPRVKAPRMRAAYYLPKRPLPGLVNIFQTSALFATRKKLFEIGTTYSDMVKDVIERQLYDWKPLSPKYRRFKERHGLDPRILIATHDYLDGIGVRRLKDGSVYVGVKRRRHKPSGLMLERLARIHEFGTRNKRVPARPHWRPVLSVIKRDLKQTRADLKTVAYVPVQEFLRKQAYTWRGPSFPGRRFGKGVRK